MGIDLIHPRCLVKDLGFSAFYLYRIGTLCFVLLLLVGATIAQARRPAATHACQLADHVC